MNRGPNACLAALAAVLLGTSCADNPPPASSNGDAGAGCGPCHREAVCAGPPGGRSCRQVSAAHNHACVLWAGRIRCWGRGDDLYMTGLDDAPPASRPPVELSADERPVQVSAGDGHSCALLEGGQLRCWGPNLFGQLGTGATSQHQARPVNASALTEPLADAITGVIASCGRTPAGKVLCWGQNNFSQLGISGPTNITVLVPAEATMFGSPIRDFVLAKDPVAPNTCGLSDDVVRCWGRGSGFPQTITGLIRPVDIEAETVGGCVLEASGVLRCWTYESIESPPTMLSDVRDFAGGHRHTCAVTNDGRLHCWGSNLGGEIGNGTSGGMQDKPYTIPELADVVQVTAGDRFTCAMTGDGRLWCWGRNDAGQLGLGIPDPMRTRPSQPVSYE